MLWLGGHCCDVHLISSLGMARNKGRKERRKWGKKEGKEGRKEEREREGKGEREREKIGRKEEWRPRDSAGWIRLSV